jgi:hypothetical protein
MPPRQLAEQGPEVAPETEITAIPPATPHCPAEATPHNAPAPVPIKCKIWGKETEDGGLGGARPPSPDKWNQPLRSLLVISGAVAKLSCRSSVLMG